MKNDNEQYIFFNWDQKFSVGIPSIDKQHKVLFKIIDDLFIQTFAKDIKSTPLKTYERLVTYTNVHFSYEEELFKKYDWVLTDEHIDQHKTILQDVEEIKDYIKALDPEKGALFMLEFLKTWVKEHVLEHDHQYSDFLISKGVI